jgi:hypothetical protein
MTACGLLILRDARWRGLLWMSWVGEFGWAPQSPHREEPAPAGVSNGEGVAKI